MDRLPPLKALPAFEAAARRLSFNEAAAELNVTPSAVSHAIRTLEDFLGTPLFERAGRHVTLTDEGRSFLRPVQQAMAQLRQASETLRRGHADRPLTVSAAPALTIGWLMPRLAKFQLAHPEIEVRLSATPELVDLHRTDIDVAIRSGGGQWPGLTSHFLMHEELVMVCSPDYAAAHPIRRPEDLLDAALLRDLSRLGSWRSWLSLLGIEHGESLRGPTFESTALTTEAAVAGLGIALVNKSFVETHLASNRLVIPYDFETPGRLAFYLVYRSEDSDVPRIAAFRDWILEEAA